MNVKLQNLLTRLSTNGYFYALWLSIFLTNASFASAGQELETKVNLSLEQVSVKEVFDAIEAQSSLVFMYSEGTIDTQKRLSLNKKAVAVQEVLVLLSQKTNLRFKTIGKTVYVKKNQRETTTQAKKGTGILVKGNVLDAKTKEPLMGATVSVKGSTVGTATDLAGAFQLEVPDDDAILVVSFVSYQKTEVAVAGQTELVVLLKPDAAVLKEVVVVGYATQDKADVTGAVEGIRSGGFNNGVMASTEQLFQGKVSGVRVVNSSGEPGAGVDIMIRGAGSIRSGSTPLFVVDGMPLNNANISPAGVSDGIGSARAKNPLNFLNPSDIESISVLKDASAAAIYGARGSNGVVIITTKTGKSNKANLTVDSYVGVSNTAKKLDLLTGEAYAKVNPDQTYATGVSTDWQDEIMRTALTTSNNISFSNKINTGSYYLSVSHLGQEGIIKESKFERLSGRFNINQSYLDKQRLKVNVNLTASQTTDHGVPTSDNAGATGELITHTLKANPTRPVYDAEGNLFDFDTEGSYNPIYMLDFYNDETRTLRVLGNFDLKFRLFDGLDYQFKFGLDRANSERNTTFFPNTTEIQSTGAYFQQNYETFNYLLEHYLTYNLQANGHHLNALAGFSYQSFNRSGTTFGVKDIEDRKIDPANNPSVGGDQNSIETQGFAENNELQSVFGRVNYSYQGKYLLTASLRADGSTRFGANNKYGYFPSFALGWNMAKEDFLSDAGFLQELKIRGSWGQTGNQEVPNKVTLETYSVSSTNGYYMSGETGDLTEGITYTRTANPNLKWEVVTQLNIGINYSVFNEKLYGSIDYFNKTTTDAILLLPAIQPNFSDVWTNMDGQIVNKGLEFTLGSKLINTSDLVWTVDVNGATLDNEVKNLPVSEILSGNVSGSGVTGEMVNIYRNGYAAGSFYLKDHLGFDDQGLSMYADDKIIIEGALPKFTYGISSYLRYKNIDLSFTLSGQYGGYLFNNTKSATNIMANLLGSKNVTDGVLNSGQSKNDALVISDYFLEKSDYIRLNNLRVGYTVAMPSVKWMSKFTVYATGQNLLTITDYTGYDPSVNTTKNVGGNSSLGMDYASYPSARTFLLGVTLNY